MTRARPRTARGSASSPNGWRRTRREARSRVRRMPGSVTRSPYKSVPVNAMIKAPSGWRFRNRSIDGRLRRAWSAMSTSHSCSPYSRSTRTRCPSARRMRAQRRAVTRLPVWVPVGAGVTREIRTASSLDRAGAEAGPDIPALRREVVAPGVPDESRPGGPGAAAQDFALPEPRLGILPVRVGDESRIREKRAARPFPDVADQLAAPRGTIALRERAHVHAPHAAPVEVGVRRGGRAVAPGEAPLAPGELQALGVDLRGGREFPLRFRRQPASRPPAVRIRLVPVDVHDRAVRLEGDPPVEVAPAPGATGAPPVHRLLRLGTLAPAPSVVAPPFAPPVSVVLDERGELGLRHGRPRDRKRANLHRVGPFLVVECEGPVGSRAEHQRASGQGRVAGQRPPAGAGD